MITCCAFLVHINIAYSDPTSTQLAKDADVRLFRSIKYSEHHVLQQFIPEHTQLQSSTSTPQLHLNHKI